MTAESANESDMRTLSRTRERERAVAALAGRQHGVVSRAQLAAIGLEPGAIGRRLRAGRLHQLHAGVYAVGHRVIGREGRWMAAVLASGPGAVLSHRSAAALWGVRPSSRELVDVTVPRRSRSSAAIFRHVSAIPIDEWTIEDGIPVTGMARTILDLAAGEPVDHVERLLREAEFRELRDRLALPDLLRRYPRRRGVRRVQLALRRLESLPPGRTESPLEERFLRFLEHHRLPRPRLNDWIVLPGGRYRVDCHWPACRQIVELDGWRAHAGRAAFQGDRARDRALRVGGYEVTRVTGAQLEREPEALAADLRRLLAKAAEYKRP